MHNIRLSLLLIALLWLSQTVVMFAC